MLPLRYGCPGPAKLQSHPQDKGVFWAPMMTLLRGHRLDPDLHVF